MTAASRTRPRTAPLASRTLAPSSSDRATIDMDLGHRVRTWSRRVRIAAFLVHVSCRSEARTPSKEDVKRVRAVVQLRELGRGSISGHVGADPDPTAPGDRQIAYDPDGQCV